MFEGHKKHQEFLTRDLTQSSFIVYTYEIRG